MKALRAFRNLALVALVLSAGVASVSAQNKNSNIAATKHNLSSGTSNEARASSGAGGTDQICVFCHTPHGANAAAPGPLWNRSLSNASYTRYTSTSFDSAYITDAIAEVGGGSKLCLSCHDGTLALGAVSNKPGRGAAGGITMVEENQKMPVGDGVTTGYTRNLGTDLSNDHPISFKYDPTLVSRDGELRSLPVTSGSQTVVGPRTGGSKPLLPLDPLPAVHPALPKSNEGLVQCTTCHDPHLAPKPEDLANTAKFLRLNRFQTNASATGAFSLANDQICLACHDKLGLAWGQSAHAKDTVAKHTYKTDAAAQRGFPDGIAVWRVGCLNCHDTHTVQGARRLLREGTDNTSSPKAGGNPALEETCYQCHSASSIVEGGDKVAPDIKSEFSRAVKMPITSGNQAAGSEKHNIGGNFGVNFGGVGEYVDCSTSTNKCGANFIEPRSLLGAGIGNIGNRHAECTDCHNPHRVIRNSLFTGGGDDSKSAHTAGGANGNLASGALRGTWGVEPTYSTTWLVPPTSFEVKRGDPGTGTISTARTAGHLTREYQLCFKCHSNYAYNDNGEYGSGSSTNMAGTDTKGDTSGRPKLSSFSGGTNDLPATVSKNGMTTYTNQAAEWSVGANDNGNGADQAGGSGNKRSWHPVTFPTKRTLSVRGITGTTPWLAPFNQTTTGNEVGNQTMHCSDCHGADAGDVQGPHGSGKKFLLKADWGEATNNQTPDHLCFRCHASAVYIGSNEDNRRTGFSGGASHNYHNLHNANSASGARNRCTICHIAVPHGWKNRSFLVNLRDVGAEGGFGSSTHIPDSQFGTTTTSGYTNPPYYLNAKLKVLTWAQSGSWAEASCGSSSGSTSTYGEGWMNSRCGG